MILDEIFIIINDLEWNDIEFTIAQSMTGNGMSETAVALAHLDTQMLLETVDSSASHVFNELRPHLLEVHPVADLLPERATTPQVAALIHTVEGENSQGECQQKRGLDDREQFQLSYLAPALHGNWVERAIPDKPLSSLQRYRLTEKGTRMKDEHDNHLVERTTEFALCVVRRLT